MDYRLRPVDDSDIKAILDWRNSDRVRKNMYTDHKISMHEHQEWFQKIKHDRSVDYKICEFRERAIGLVCFTQISDIHKRCYWGFYLGETDVPVKSGPIMEFFALNYAFERLNIRKICCEVFAFNASVIKLHKKFGFKEEGVFLKHVLKAGSYVDVVSLALFDENWTYKEQDIKKLLF